MYSTLLGAWLINVSIIGASWDFFAEQTTDHATISLSCREGDPGVKLSVDVRIRNRGVHASFADMKTICNKTGTGHHCEFAPKAAIPLAHLLESFPIQIQTKAGKPIIEVSVSNQKTDVVLRQADMYCRGLVRKYSSAAGK